MSLLLDLATTTALEAGKNLRHYFGNIDVHKNKSERANDLVTKLDIDTELFIENEFKKHEPTIGFVGEEFGERAKSDRYWLVDPIDGTGHFFRGIPFSTTMIALIENEEVVLSVIYNFIEEKMYTAQKGQGAKLNNKSIHVSDRPLKYSYISVESNFSLNNNINKYLWLTNHAIVLKTINCGYEFGLIAEGKLDGRICIDPFGHDWDFAAGTLLVTEAGGVVKNIGKDTYDFKNHNFIASNPKVYEKLSKEEILLEK